MVRIIIVLIVTILFSSCVTQKGALNYLHSNPEFASKYCADAFPITEKVVKETIYIKADNVDYTDLIDSVNNANQKQIDSLKAIANRDTTDNCLDYKKLIKTLKNPIERVKKIYVPCVSDTVKIKEFVTKENTAKIESLTLEVDKYQRLYNRYKDICIALGIIIVVLSCIILIKRK